MPEPSVAEVEPARFSEVGPRVARIDDEVRAVDGHSALGDSVWFDLEAPGRDSAGFLEGDQAYAHIARADNAAPDQWSLGLVVAPDARGGGTRNALVRAALTHVGRHGGGRVTLWVLGATTDDDAQLLETGFRPARELFEMRVPLPIVEEPNFPPGVRVRPFEVGRDESEWLGVNNHAFAGHAEQGGWTESTLARRVAEPWFDPAIFLLAHDADGLLGFNWLKIHELHDGDPCVGEIYVIGVDPRGQAAGLGRALAIAGLRAVSDRGIDTGMLFCAADNHPALKLYRSLGFEVHRVDRAYECEMAPT